MHCFGVAQQLALSFPSELPNKFERSTLLENFEPLGRGALAGTWDFERVRAARDAQMRGDFRTSAALAEAVKTDPAIFGALLNRLCPHRRLTRTWSSVNAKITAEAERTFPQDGVNLSAQTIADIFEGIVQLGVQVSQNRCTVSSDGSRIDFRLEPWPMRSVWFDWATCELKTLTTKGIKVIRHGDGKWVVSHLHAAMPWEWGTVKAIAEDWARRVLHKRDRSLNSETHGEGKYIGELPESVKLESATGQKFVEMVMGLRERRSGGVHPHGASVKMLEAISQMWQIWKEAIGSLDKDIARAYLGQDGTMVNEGGNYIKAAELAGVRYDLVEGDIKGVAAGINTGVLRPWSIVNLGRDAEIKTGWALPDPDEQAKREAYGKRVDAFNKAIGEMRANGFVIDQPLVERVAREFGIEAPKLDPKGPPARAPSSPPA